MWSSYSRKLGKWGAKESLYIEMVPESIKWFAWVGTVPMVFVLSEEA